MTTTDVPLRQQQLEATLHNTIITLEFCEARLRDGMDPEQVAIQLEMWRHALTLEVGTPPGHVLGDGRATHA